MNQDTKHLFVINPKSFWRKTKQNQVVSGIYHFFKEKNDNNYEIFVSQFPRDAVGFIPLFAKNLPDTTTLRVYAVGGDGILFDCLNGIMRLENVELAAVPYGLTNNFIRGFGKNDKALFQLISQQYNSPTVPMDVIRCGNNYTLNYCAIGIEAEAAYHAGRTQERLKNGNALNQWLCRRLYSAFYFTGGIAACSNKKLLQQKYEVDVDGEKFVDVCQGFSFFNGAYYGGGLHPASNAMPNDGILDMFVIRCRGALQACFLFPFYESGRYRMFPRNFVMKQGNKITIDSDEPLTINMDGIAFFESGLEIELLPAAIRFVDAGKHGYKGSSRE